MKYFVLLIVTLLFTSCDLGSRSNFDEDVKLSDIRFFTDIKAPIECDEECKKQFVYDLMHDSYLWADQTPILSQQEILDTPDDVAMLRSLKTADDKFSYIITKEQYDNFFQAGVNSGFGFFPAFVQDLDGKIYIDIILVYPDSPADKAGLKRGDYISTIDGISSDEIYQNLALQEYYFGDEEENLTISLGFDDFGDVNITKSEFKIKNVLHQEVINQNSSKIGYLVFQSFIGTSIGELYESISTFKDEGINELIVDLRYNGGGYIYVAKYLSSLIGGEKLRGKVFNKTIFNQKYSSYNSSDYFDNIPTYALNLSRVFVITTQSSCSASELVINTFRANDNDVEVIQIGSSTCGKPYGMIGASYGDSYILPVQMKSVNGDNIGDYIDGIMPRCDSYDNISKDFGDMDEDSLVSALYFIENGSCKKSSRKIFLSKENILDGFRGTYGLF